MKYVITGIILFLLLAGGVAIYKGTTSPKVEREEKDIKTSTMVIGKEVKEANESENVMDKLEERYSKPQAAVEYLFGVAMLNDPNLFPDAFTVEQFMSDVSSANVDDKLQYTQDIMDQLTKKGSLEKIQIAGSMWTFEKDSVRVLCDLYYEDLASPIRVNIKVKQVEMENSAHGEHQQSVKHHFFLVDTSVWDIINKIEQG